MYQYNEKLLLEFYTTTKNNKTYFILKSPLLKFAYAIFAVLHRGF